MRKLLQKPERIEMRAGKGNPQNFLRVVYLLCFHLFRPAICTLCASFRPRLVASDFLCLESRLVGLQDDVLGGVLVIDMKVVVVGSRKHMSVCSAVRVNWDKVIGSRLLAVARKSAFEFVENAIIFIQVTQF